MTFWHYSAFLIIGAALPLCADSPTSPQEALKQLLAGNQRYVQDALEHPNRNAERREAIAAKQKPFAVILGCADSRVSPEIIFDQGVGDLFVVRVAGNVVGPLELDSVEYAALYLNASLILVLGHESCGAVQAVIDGQTKDIEAVATLIAPSVDQARKRAPQDLLTTSIQMNAKKMSQDLQKSQVLADLIAKKKLEIHPAYYHLQSGSVELLP